MLTVRPPGKVRLSMPSWVSMKEGIRFLESRTEWISSAIAKYSEDHPAEVIEMPYSTRNHHLELNPAEIAKVKLSVRNGIISVSYPLDRDFRAKEIQDVVKKGIEEAWRAEAKEYLPIRVAQLAREHGFRFGKVTIRNTVSKWGSCSVHNDISLSLHLMRLPDHLIDYVLLHELCHTVHKNHGPGFHQLLDAHTGGRHKALHKELRKYTTRW